MNLKNMSPEEIRKLIEESENGEITINSENDDDWVFQIPEDFKMTPEQEKEENAFRALLTEMMKKDKEEANALSFDDQYGDDNKEESEDYSLIDEIPFNPKMPLTEKQKEMIQLRNKISQIVGDKLHPDSNVRILNNVLSYFNGGMSWVYNGTDYEPAGSAYLIKELNKVDKSKLSTEIKNLFDECLEYLNNLRE